MAYRIAVVGASGNVGRESLQILAERQFPIQSIDAVASDRSAGSPVSFGEEQILKIQPLSQFDFTDIDLAFFCTSGKVSREYIPRALAAGCKVIDKSSEFRLEPKVPLIIPEINGEQLRGLSHGVVANPNCVAVPLALALSPLHRVAGVKRAVITTYQSVSGAGKEAMDELELQTRALYANQSFEPAYLPRQIAFNLIPHIDKFDGEGHTGEETKIMAEIKKIVAPSIQIAATCVRVPVFIGHSISVAIELEKPLAAKDAREVLANSAGLMVIDRPAEEIYVTPLDVIGEDVAFISRIRQDLSVKNGLLFWISCDNLRKGAALNGVQIAETWLLGAGR